ncbi:MAG: LysR family transcriptional regulator [Stappia sp.]|uniref:LysR family transcriptional regulator n=1 Tax=Stappia sp. TaxID=1870903 RepID=UPI000C600CF0|nr:LysR family transcriptional regulator [Stappia sp.]MAA98534.1 LysR family transcriptional regulator [Stappia sp.]MBM21374.1 LysR family transcriptional regulator [Stappia sp.]
MSYVNMLKVFVRVVDLGSMSAAARDQRVSPAVVSSRIAELEKHLGVRLFNRTTRKLAPTEHGTLFHKGAIKILEAIEEAEGAVVALSRNPRGSIFAAAPLGIGRRLIAPLIPLFKKDYPEVDVRLRLSDRTVDVLGEGLDLAFVLGTPADSELRMRAIHDCERVLCASPAYLEEHGFPECGADLVREHHHCLLLRFPGANEFHWTLGGPRGAKRYEVSGPFESDDGDVLTDWALAGAGIVNKPRFEVAEHLASGRLVEVCRETPPLPVRLACLYPHKRYEDPKIRIFADFVAERCRAALSRPLPDPAGA